MRIFITKYNWNDQVEEDETGGACSWSGGREKHIGYWWVSQRERDHWEDQDIGEWIILRWLFYR
jgi:hypothetical protein